jgi:uncharacterized protein YukE
MEIKLSDAEITSKVATMKSYATQIDTLSNSVTNTMNSIIETGSFKGAAANAYREATESMIANVLVPLRSLLNTYAPTLEAAKNKLTFQDDEIAQSVYSKFGGIRVVK